MNTNDKGQIKNLRQREYLTELLNEILDPNHKRMIQAYQGDDPVNAMEIELGKLLLEILNRED